MALAAQRSLHPFYTAMTPTPSTSRAADARAHGDPERQRHVVIYIEDNPLNVALMADLLGDYECVELVATPSAEIGIELIRSRKTDLVIMDINLPGMNGFEAARRLASWPETRDVPILALSAALPTRDATRLGEASFRRYMTKPVEIDEFTSVLDELLGHPAAPAHD